MKSFDSRCAVIKDATSRKSVASSPHSRSRKPVRSAVGRSNAAEKICLTLSHSETCIMLISTILQLSIEPRFGYHPLAFDRGRRHFDHPCRLIDSQPAKKSELDYLALSRVEFRQLIES